MANVTNLSGIPTVLRNLRKAHKGLGDAAARGMKRAGLLLQRESQLIVPVDTGALKNSGYTRAIGHGWDTEVFVGYTQVYAVFVHENLEARHQEGKFAKFLERPLREKKMDLIQTIRKSIDRDALRFGLPPTRNKELFGGGGA